MGTVVMNASTIGGMIQTAFSGNILVPTNGLITVQTQDVPSLLLAGAAYVSSTSTFATVGPCRAGTAGQIVASTSLANGTLSIANQPDVGRVLAARIDPGTTAVTAGVLTMIYRANDGTITTDALSITGGATTAYTVSTTKAVMVSTSNIVTALAGGTTPKIEITDTNALGLTVSPGYAAITVFKENTDGANTTIGTVNSSAAAVTPTTTPNGTHVYGWGYNYTYPNT